MKSLTNLITLSNILRVLGLTLLLTLLSACGGSSSSPQQVAKLPSDPTTPTPGGETPSLPVSAFLKDYTKPKINTSYQ